MGRILHASRRVVSLFLLGVLAIASGCSEDKGTATTPSNAAEEKTRQDNERAAREKAFGPGGATSEAPKK